MTACMRSVFPMNGQEKPVSYRVLYGTKRAINIGEIVPKEQIKTGSAQKSQGCEMLFQSAIRIGDSAEIERAAHWRDGKAS